MTFLLSSIKNSKKCYWYTPIWGKPTRSSLEVTDDRRSNREPKAQANRSSYIHKSGGSLYQWLHFYNKKPVPPTPHTFLESNATWGYLYMLSPKFYQTPGSRLILKNKSITRRRNMVDNEGNVGLDYWRIKFHYTVDAGKMQKNNTPYKESLRTEILQDEAVSRAIR